MIATLIWKDFKLFFRNQFFAIATALSLVSYIAVYFLMPSEVTDKFRVAIHVENMDQTNVDETFERFFEYTMFSSVEELKAALTESDEYFIGLSVDAEQAAGIASGQSAEVDVYFSPHVPAEIKSAYQDLVTLMANSANPVLAPRLARLNQTSQVLGRDIYGAPIPARDRMIPLMLLFMLSVEVIGLATLLSQEVEMGTARAILTSPLRVGQFFWAKAMFGVSLAFIQLVVLLAATGKLSHSPLLVLTTLVLGSLMVTGVAFLIAAISKDSMSVMGWGTLAIVVLGIPAVSVILPGLATGWSQLIPSFHLVDSLHGILNFGESWADVAAHHIRMAIVAAITLTLGAYVLRNQFST